MYSISSKLDASIIAFLNVFPPSVVTNSPLLSPFVPARPGSFINPIFSSINTNFEPLWIWIKPSTFSSCSSQVLPPSTDFSIPIRHLPSHYMSFTYYSYNNIIAYFLFVKNLVPLFIFVFTFHFIVFWTGRFRIGIFNYIIVRFF